MRIEKLKNNSSQPSIAPSAPQRSLQPKYDPALANTNFATQRTVTFDDGTSINLPTLSDAEQNKAASALKGMTDDQIKAFQAAGLQIGHAFNQAGLAAAAAANSSGNSTTADAAGSVGAASSASGQALTGANLQQASSGLSAQVGPQANIASPQLTQSVVNAATVYQAANPTSDYDDTVQAVSFQGVQGMLQDLTGYAQHVQSNLNDKKEMETEAQDLNNELSDWPDDVKTKDFQITSYDENGKKTVSTKTLDKAGAKSALDGLNNVISGFSDQDQIDQLNLQQMSQNYSQGLTTISNLLKMNFDTVKGIIGNIRS